MRLSLGRAIRSSGLDGSWLRRRLAQLLRRTHACRLLKIRRRGYVLRFFPSALSEVLWMSPQQHREDEGFLRRYLKPGDGMIDVGANIGLLSIVGSRLVGSDGWVCAIEPNPRIYHYLRHNVRLNGARNVRTVNMVAGARTETVQITDRYSDESNRVTPSGEKSVAVAAQRLDSLRLRAGPIALVKIDAEGYEKFVLEGAEKILCRTLCVYFESWNLHFGNYGYASPDVLRMLQDNGLAVYSLSPGGKLAPVSASHQSVDCEDLIAVRDLRGFRNRTGYE